MTDQDYARTVQVVPQPDEHTVRLRPLDPSLGHVMGRFGAAQWNRSAHAWDVPAHLWQQFRTFARVHELHVIEPPTPLPQRGQHDHSLSTEMAEARTRRGTEAQTEANSRGIALVRMALDLARRKALRDKGTDNA